MLAVDPKAQYNSNIMTSEKKRIVLGWVCLVALLGGFGLFTRMMIDHFENEFDGQLVVSKAPPPPPIVWEKGPGQSWIQQHDGQTFDGSIVMIQHPNQRSQTHGIVKIRTPEIRRSDGSTVPGKIKTIFFDQIKTVHRGDEDKLDGRRCVFTLKGGKTVEGLHIQETKTQYLIKLISNGTLIRLQHDDVVSIHQFDKAN